MLNPHVTNKLCWTIFLFKAILDCGSEAVPLRPVSSSPETFCWSKHWKMSYKASEVWCPKSPWSGGNHCFSNQLSNPLQPPLFFSTPKLLCLWTPEVVPVPAKPSCPATKVGLILLTANEWLTVIQELSVAGHLPFRKMTWQWLFNCIL